jgi:hypothetical protein
VRRKAVLKHTQSKHWREVWCGTANAKRLDCVRFIAAFPDHSSPDPLPKPCLIARQLRHSDSNLKKEMRRSADRRYD